MMPVWLIESGLNTCQVTLDSVEVVLAADLLRQPHAVAAGNDDAPEPTGRPAAAFDCCALHRLEITQNLGSLGR